MEDRNDLAESLMGDMEPVERAQFVDVIRQATEAQLAHVRRHDGLPPPED